MAERKNRRIADNSDVQGSDPFAELTRIMGFDPRVAGMAQKQTTPQDDAFAIDLERELMGELEADPALRDQLMQAVSFEETVPFSRDARNDEIAIDSDEFEQDLNASLDAEMAAEEADLIAEDAELTAEDVWDGDSAKTAADEMRIEADGAEPSGSGDFEDFEVELASLLDDDYRQADSASGSNDLEEMAIVSDGGSRYDADPDHSVEPPQDIDTRAADTADEAAELDWSPDVLETDSDDLHHAAGGAEQFDVAPAIGAGEVVDDPFAELAAMAAAPSPVPSRPRLSLATPFLKRQGADAPVGFENDYDDNDADTPMIVEPANAWPSFALASNPADATAEDSVDQSVRGIGFEPDAEVVATPAETIAVLDDLDIPEFETVSAAAGPIDEYDDLDLDLEMSPGDFRRAEPEPAHRADVPNRDGETEIVLDLDDLSDSSSDEAVTRAEDFDAFGTPGDEDPEAYGNQRVYHDSARQQAWTAAAVVGAASLSAGKPADAATARGADTFDFNNSAEQDSAFPAAAIGSRRADRGRGYWVAGLIAGVAILGGLGAFAVSFGGGDDTSSATIIRADAEPVKVKPENPGGATVPNQDNPVYDSVAASASPTAAPVQEKLISATEEPVDVAAQLAADQPPEGALPALDGDAQEIATDTVAVALPGVESPEIAALNETVLPSAKNEQRLEPSAEDAQSANDEIVAVTPRKVRTMVVRPDGTLVPREDPVAAAQPEEPVATAAAALVEDTPSQALPPVLPATTPKAASPALAPAATTSNLPKVATPIAKPTAAAPAPKAVTPAQKATPVAVATANTDAAAVKPAPVATAPAQVAAVEPQRQSSQTPARVPVAPSRPADQPVDIVGGVGNRATEVAALEPQPAPTASGGWTMQIASQPSVDGAQASYQSLARRYESVIGGRGVSIVKADIAGKGTFYRVRVPAGSRNDAINLCERYKSAGGSCFVSR